MVIDPERIESLKAGSIAGAVGIAISLVLVGLDSFPQGDSFLTQAILLQAIQRLAIAAVCCFLFGVTYRYIIRQDSNPHLRSGAVGAFALTRSLSQLEGVDLSGLGLAGIWPLSIPIAESFGLFLTVRLVLDLGLKQRWLKPFSTTSG
ncbi:hypothetical protein [Leptothoe sp. PORK10 BA2]|uniref:hypothetical protein n=1 Tax=Leptothoe sp. PORK10 BA2 TaxID=3110254 RepID=UPI002B1FAC47|nr:hypothetical protein [Leptothoe sp. PORK10 BA2]MEA5464786.1 hypothetical protein [Leptothoe sp. PORK10 BA2]